MRCIDCNENVRQELSHFIKMGLVPIVCRHCGAMLEISKTLRIFILMDFLFIQLLSSEAWRNRVFDEILRDAITPWFYFTTVIVLLLIFFAH
jgi:hypothetical protein